MGSFVELTGIAVGAPTVSLSTPAVVFPQRAIGSTSVAIIVTLTNSGTDSLKVSAVNLTGAVQNNFSQTNTCATVAPGATRTVNVTFAPTSSGTRAASIQILSNAGSSPDPLQLSGSAQ